MTEQKVPVPDGTTRYELSGTGPLVVLVHGMTAPMHVWDPTVEALNGAGFRTLRYDLFGRGDSDRPKTKYDIDLFHRQLQGLLSALAIDEPFHLAAFSWGCGIAAHFADRHPDRIRRIVFLAPGGLPHLYRRNFGLMKIPLLGETILALFGSSSLLEDARKNFFSPDRFPDFFTRFREQLDRPGYGRSFLSTLRNTPADFTPVYRALGGRRKEILLLWGRNDGKVPVENAVRFEELLPGSSTIAFPDAAHAVHWDRPEEVHHAMTSFLS